MRAGVLRELPWKRINVFYNLPSQLHLTPSDTTHRPPYPPLQLIGSTDRWHTHRTLPTPSWEGRSCGRAASCLQAACLRGRPAESFPHTMTQLGCADEWAAPEEWGVTAHVNERIPKLRTGTGPEIWGTTLEVYTEQHVPQHSFPNLVDSSDETSLYTLYRIYVAAAVIFSYTITIALSKIWSSRSGDLSSGGFRTGASPSLSHRKANWASGEFVRAKIAGGAPGGGGWVLSAGGPLRWHFSGKVSDSVSFR